MSSHDFFRRFRYARQVARLERKVDRVITQYHRRYPNGPSARQIEAQLREERENGDQQ